VSAASTGWCVLKNGSFEYGTIKTKPKLERSNRLSVLRKELTVILKKYKPQHIVVENGFSGINVKTLKILCEFVGVAKECCFNVVGIDPYVMSNHTVKAYFKVKTKEELYYFIVSIIGFEDKGWTFKKHNDITDSLAQCVCYYDTILNKKKFRKEMDYGFKYTIKE
jgi:Holliday junction resolvasome RuvABC endonuclease subunit